MFPHADSLISCTHLLSHYGALRCSQHLSRVFAFSPALCAQLCVVCADFQFASQPDNTLANFGVAAAEYIDQQLAYYYMEQNKTVSRVIDAELGPGFGVVWVSLYG